MMTSATNNAKTKQEDGPVVPPATTASGGGDDRSGHEAADECTSRDCAVAGIIAATALAGVLVIQALATFSDQPASLVLELSCVLCAVLYAWACFTTRQLITAEGRRVLWWIVDAGAVAVIAGWAFGTVAAMLVMYATSLGVAGLFAWCLVEYFLTRNSTDTTSTYKPLDLEAGLRRENNMTGPRVKPMTSRGTSTSDLAKWTN